MSIKNKKPIVLNIKYCHECDTKHGHMFCCGRCCKPKIKARRSKKN